jgi:hypothetical protein
MKAHRMTGAWRRELIDLWLGSLLARPGYRRLWAARTVS